MTSLTIGIGQRPYVHQVVIADGHRFDLGPQVEGDDWIARFYNWRHRRRVERYIRHRLAHLTGDRLAQFQTEVDRTREARRG